MSNKNRDTKPEGERVEQAADRYAYSLIKMDDSPLTTVQDDFKAGANWQKEQYTERVEGETLYPFTEAKLMATRFAKYSRDAGDVTSNDTITSFDNWFKPEYFKPVVTTPSTSTTIDELADKYSRDKHLVKGYTGTYDLDTSFLLGQLVENTKQDFKSGYNLRDKEQAGAVEKLQAELIKANNTISYYKNHFSKEKYNDGVYLQKNNDNREWSAEEWIEEFYEFLKTGEADKIQVKHKPMLSEEQAFTVIWYLQEHFPLLPDNIDQCDVCKSLYNTHSTGYYTEIGNEHGNSFCGSCEYLAPDDNEEEDNN